MTVSMLLTSDQLNRAYFNMAPDKATPDSVRLTLLVNAAAAAGAYERTRDSLISALEGCNREVTEALSWLKERGITQNCLGVLQSRGPEVDRLCGELDCRRQAALGALEMLAQHAPTVYDHASASGLACERCGDTIAPVMAKRNQGRCDYCASRKGSK